MINANTSKIGECETCTNTDTKITLRDRGMWMCDTCSEKLNKIPELNQMLQQSRKIDEAVQIKTDIFVAKTTAAMNLHASIQQDDSIPADQKDYVFAKETMARYQHFKKVVFEDREALQAKENEMRMWQVQVQTAAGKLHGKYKDEFKAIDISYQPTTPKSIKPVKSPNQTPTKSATVQAREAREAAAKYGIDASAVQMIAKSRKISAMEAAEFFAKQIGKIPVNQ